MAHTPTPEIDEAMAHFAVAARKLVAQYDRGLMTNDELHSEFAFAVSQTNETVMFAHITANA